MDRTDICTNNEVTRQIDVSGRDWTGLPGLTMGAVCVWVCVCACAGVIWLDFVDHGIMVCQENL